MIEVKGLGAVARILKDSISPQGIRLTTMEIETPRITWAEFLTHGMLARNAHSSRAIPFDKMAEQLTGKPVRFGQANPGMQDKGVDFDAPVTLWTEPSGIGESGYYAEYTPQEAWELARMSAVGFSRAYHEAGYHKQVYNRLTETFQMIKAVVTATEWDNFYWLRDDIAADPTLHDLASTMRKAHEQSVPQLLLPGEWHLPYVDEIRDEKGKQVFYIRAEEPSDINSIGLATPLTIEQAIKVSSARTGAVSFRNVDYGLEKCLEVYDKLVGDVRKHASAMQHQATPMKPHVYEHGFAEDFEENNHKESSTWEPGISHADRDGDLWSAQLRGWIMNRKLIPGENYKKPIAP